jgi:hypothetical protein
MKRRNWIQICFLFFVCMGVAVGAPLALADAASSSSDAAGNDEQSETAELAKKLQNPIASLISVPIQNNWDFGIGPKNAMRYTANLQPVIPFSIGKDWNLITRTILPVIYAEEPVKGFGNKFGLGDTLQSFFLSPKEPVGGWILGGGPVFQWPTSSDLQRIRKQRQRLTRGHCVHDRIAGMVSVLATVEERVQDIRAFRQHLIQGAQAFGRLVFRCYQIFGHTQPPFRKQRRFHVFLPLCATPSPHIMPPFSA